MSDYTGGMAWMNLLLATEVDLSQIPGKQPNHQISVELKSLDHHSATMILRKAGVVPDIWELMGGQNETAINNLSHKYNETSGQLVVTTLDKDASNRFVQALSGAKAEYRHTIL